MLHYKRLSTFRIKQIISTFCADITASKTAVLLGINRNTINQYFNEFRRAVYAEQMREAEKIFGEADVDESYFGGRRKRGFQGKLKRGRGTLKQPVFGIVKRNGRVYTKIVPNYKKATLQAIIRGKIDPSTTVYSDKWRGYDGLVDVGYAAITGCTTARMNFRKGTASISTASRISGALPNGGSRNLTASERTSRCTSKSASGDTASRFR